MPLSAARSVNASMFHRLVGGLVPRLDFSPNAPRVSADVLHKQWSDLIGSSQSDATPVAIASRSKLSELDIFGFAILSAPTARRALQTAATFFPLLNSSGTWRLDHSIRTSRLVWDLVPAEDAGARASVESALAHFVSGIRETCPNARAIRVFVAHRPPRERSAFDALCRSEVTFDAPGGANAIEVDWTSNAPAPRLADTSLHELLKRQCDAGMTSVLAGQTTVVDEVYETIGALLEGGAVGLAVVARHHAMSERTLARRLADHGTRFGDILDKVRRRQAKALLSNRSIPISEVANKLGFAEASSLSRRCREWFGASPSVLRQRDS